MTHEAVRVLTLRIQAELDALERVFQRAQAAVAAMDNPEIRQLAIDAAALNVHDWYVGVERIFESIADNVDRSTPDGPSWHRDLLQQMALQSPDLRPAILDRDTHHDLTILLGFHHVVRNVYSYDLDADAVLANVGRVAGVFPRVRESLLAFVDWLKSLESA